MPDLASLLDKLNFTIPGGRWQLLEFVDLWIVPPFIKHDHQDALTARWTKRLPFLQLSSPAELAADIIRDSLESFPDVDFRDWKIVDFGSGNGGPVPLIEKYVNSSRRSLGKKAIPFQLSDINPNLNIDSWMGFAAHSENLSFIPDAVDATNPTFSAISTTTKGDREKVEQAGLEWNGSKIYRLYCATFHHFDDEVAAKAVRSTMQTSDGFAIVEVQERTIFSLMFVLLEVVVVMVMSILWFWRDPMLLFFTYVVPLLPLTQLVDGWIGCLRTRSFQEFLRLVMKANGYKVSVEVQGDGESARFQDWEFKHVRLLHTWPIGYVNVITGRKVSSQ